MNSASQLTLGEQRPFAGRPLSEAAQSRLETIRPSLQRVTEVVLPQAAGVCEAMLLPMLEHLSRQQPQRWLTWIGKCVLSREAFRDYDLTTDRLRRVTAPDDEAVLTYALTAMSAGTSQTVIAALGNSPASHHLAALENAAVRGNCFGIVLRRWG